MMSALTRGIGGRMMKPPDKIKKGLQIVVNGCLPCDRPITDCPYDLEYHPMNEDTNVDMPKEGE